MKINDEVLTWIDFKAVRFEKFQIKTNLEIWVELKIQKGENLS
jgi:hypothetical protein